MKSCVALQMFLILKWKCIFDKSNLIVLYVSKKYYGCYLPREPVLLKSLLNVYTIYCSVLCKLVPENVFIALRKIRHCCFYTNLERQFQFEIHCLKVMLRRIH